MSDAAVHQLLEEGIRHHQSGQFQEAESFYRQVLALQPDQPDALHYLGVLAGQAGRHDAAIDLIRGALAARPADREAQLNLANSLTLRAKKLRGDGKLAESIPLLLESLAVQPDNIAAHHDLALALREAGQLDQAIAAIERLMSLHPDLPEAHNNLGNLLLEKGERHRAIASFEKAISLRLDYVEALNNVGNALREENQFEQAVSSLRQAVALRPDLPQVRNNLANALRDTGQHHEAIAEYRRALDLNPRYAQAWNNLGVALRESGEIERAMEAHRRAIEIQPDYADAHFALGWSLLLTDDFRQGWPEYEWRLRRKPVSPLERTWDGGDLSGRTILLHAEQGFGDTIQFARYAPLVARRGGKVVLVCQHELVRLLEKLPGVDRVVSNEQPLPEFSVRCPLMSLPLVFGTDAGSIPSDVPYLAPDPKDAARWAGRMGPDRKRKVGLAWSGRVTHPDDRNRSIPPRHLIPLTQVQDVAFHSLQPGPAASDRADGMDFMDHSTALRDFADTAALIANLDLVITADTAVAHLAGAMGKPVWILLPFSPDWRWMRNRIDSPWYPTMRLFRQPQPRDWSSVIDNVVQALRGSTAGQ